jgi:hypothetical protein
MILLIKIGKVLKEKNENLKLNKIKKPSYMRVFFIVVGQWHLRFFEYQILRISHRKVLN